MKRILLMVAMLLSIHVAAQNVRGRVVDGSNGNALFGVHVFSESGKGTSTDNNGRFEFLLKGEELQLGFSFIGYKSTYRSFSATDIGTEVLIELQPESTYIDLVVITSSQYEKKIEEEIVAIDVIQPYLITNTNAPDLKGSLARIPSLSILDGQASIRGGSGYSYGTGSRVQLLLDGMPLLSGDLSEIWWSYVPIETISQIEVVKGASSSLYGSGALNGVINVRTGWPDGIKKTNIGIYQGVYSRPDNPLYQWWDKTYTPTNSGAFVSAYRTIGNLDLVMGGNYTSDKTYIQNGQEQHVRFNIKSKYQFKKVPGLIASLCGNVQYQQQGRFFFWDNDTTGIYKPLAGTESEDRYFLYNIDPQISYLGKKNGLHKIQARLFHNSRFDDNNFQTSTSNLYFTEYRFQRMNEKGGTLNTGISNNYQQTFSDLYPGLSLRTMNPAAYLQYEQKINKLTLVAGSRVEWNLNGSVYSEFSNPIFRFGLNQQIGKNTFLRASFGESYRFASIAEKYVEAELNALVKIRPNLLLNSEEGTNFELGIKRKFRSDIVNGFADVSAFVLEYTNLIEYTFGYDSVIYFQPQNIGRARISGLEFNLSGDVKIQKSTLSVFGGYTVVYAGDLSSDTTQIAWSTYLNNVGDFFAHKTDFNTNKILKYRNRDQVKFDAQWAIGDIQIGGTIYFNSFMDRIDEIFTVLIPGLTYFRENYNTGFTTFDLRCNYEIREGLSLSVVSRNIMNAVVSARPGILDAPRNTSVRLDIKF
jgi:outer membrane cobalamin receptor